MGTQAFKALFERRDAGEWLARAGQVHISSDDPEVLSWPWEALNDPQAGSYLAHARRVEHRLNRLPYPPALGAFPKERINILLMVARPYERDVGYRLIPRPLIELIAKQGLPAAVDVLRPPTFEQLWEHLRALPDYYQVLHFDGYGERSGSSSAHQFRARQGWLIFENEKGDADPRTAGDLNALLWERAVPAVLLLNACQSAALDEKSGRRICDGGDGIVAWWDAQCGGDRVLVVRLWDGGVSAGVLSAVV